MNKIQGLHEKRKAKRLVNKKKSIIKRLVSFVGAILAIYVLTGEKEEIPNAAHEPTLIAESLDTLDLEKLTSTEDYNLIRIEGKTYLTKSFTEQNEQNELTKYYDIDSKEFVGQTISVAAYNRAYNVETEEKSTTSTVIVENELCDTVEFNGEYGYGKNLPQEAVLPLTSFVKSEIPEQTQLDYYKTDSQALNEKIEEEYEFEPISVVEYTNYVFTNEYSLFGKEKKVSFEENEHLKDKPLLQVVYVDDMDKEQTIIGYRASEHSNDKGYNVFYDIVTGNLYQLDQLRIKMLANLRKDSYTIAELKDLFYQTEVEQISTEQQEYVATPTVTTPVAHENGLYDSEEVVVLNTTANSISRKDGNPSQYIFLGMTGYSDVLCEYENLFGSGLATVTNDLILGNYYSFIDGIRITSEATVIEGAEFVYKDNGFQTINSFLHTNGYDDLIKDSYTYENLSEINNLFNQEARIHSSEIVVVDSNSSSITKNGEHDRYVFLKYKEASDVGLVFYSDMNNLLAIAQIESDGAMLYANETNTLFYRDTSLPVPYMGFIDFLKSRGLNDLIKSEYTWSEVMKIIDLVNDKEMTNQR